MWQRLHAILQRQFDIYLFKVLKGRKIYKLPGWPISMWNSPHTFIQERMKKSPVWHKNHHLQWVTLRMRGWLHIFFFPYGEDEWPVTALTFPCVLPESLWSSECKMKGEQEQLSGNVCNFGKMRGWEKLRNILLFFHFFFSIAFFLTFLWSPLFLLAHFLPSTCQWAQLRSWQGMTFRCRTLWGSVTEKRRLKKKSWLQVNEAGLDLKSGVVIPALTQTLMPWG